MLLDNPLANLSQLSQLCHPPSSCPSFGQVPGVVTEWEKEKVLMLCNHSLAIVINAVLVTDPKQPKRGFCEENQHLVSYPGVHSSVCIVLHPDYISNPYWTNHQTGIHKIFWCFDKKYRWSHCPSFKIFRNKPRGKEPL